MTRLGLLRAPEGIRSPCATGRCAAGLMGDAGRGVAKGGRLNWAWRREGGRLRMGRAVVRVGLAPSVVSTPLCRATVVGDLGSWRSSSRPTTSAVVSGSGQVTRTASSHRQSRRHTGTPADTPPTGQGPAVRVRDALCRRWRRLPRVHLTLSPIRSGQRRVPRSLVGGPGRSGPQARPGWPAHAPIAVRDCDTLCWPAVD